MNKIAEKIFNSGKVVDERGVEYDIHSNTSLEQCEYLQSLVEEIDAARCLEVGLAYGMSSLFICEAIQEKQDSVFYSIDPQQDWWKDIGLKNLMDSGCSKFLKFHRDYSHTILPELLAKDTELDFAYVDTTKVFDVVLVDIYYLIRMLRTGGILVLDDCDFPGLNKLARYLSKMPNLEVHSLHGSYQCSRIRRLFARLLKKIPFADSIFSDKALYSDCSLGVNARCIAFRKLSNDERRWDWNVSF